MPSYQAGNTISGYLLYPWYFSLYLSDAPYICEIVDQYQFQPWNGIHSDFFKFGTGDDLVNRSVGNLSSNEIQTAKQENDHF